MPTEDPTPRSPDYPRPSDSHRRTLPYSDEDPLELIERRIQAHESALEPYQGREIPPTAQDARDRLEAALEALRDRRQELLLDELEAREQAAAAYGQMKRAFQAGGPVQIHWQSEDGTTIPGNLYPSREAAEAGADAERADLLQHVGTESARERIRKSKSVVTDLDGNQDEAAAYHETSDPEHIPAPPTIRVQATCQHELTVRGIDWRRNAPRELVVGAHCSVCGSPAEIEADLISIDKCSSNRWTVRMNPPDMAIGGREGGVE